MPQLSPEQLAQVEIWAADGANLNQVQDRLKTEFGITLTYLDARLLMLDVGVRIKDKPREPEKVEAAAPAPEQEAELDAEDAEVELANDEAAPAGSLNMTTDQIAIPGALISGKVVFSDGQNASWFLDQMGRLELSGAPQGYQPPPQDIPLFQQHLDLFLQKAGF
jgi:hypothetical protein